MRKEGGKQNSFLINSTSFLTNRLVFFLLPAGVCACALSSVAVAFSIDQLADLRACNAHVCLYDTLAYNMISPGVILTFPRLPQL